MLPAAVFPGNGKDILNNPRSTVDTINCFGSALSLSTPSKMGSVSGNISGSSGSGTGYVCFELCAKASHRNRFFFSDSEFSSGERSATRRQNQRLEQQCMDLQTQVSIMNLQYQQLEKKHMDLASQFNGVQVTGNLVAGALEELRGEIRCLRTENDILRSIGRDLTEELVRRGFTPPAALLQHMETSSSTNGK